MKKLIIALDVKTIEQALKLINDLSPWVDVFKVGPVLFLEHGKEIVDAINGKGKNLFLDLKFHDIPATVQRSVAAAQKLGVYSVTVHSSGGEEMLKAAVSVNPRPKIWAVTVLTSQVTNISKVIELAELAKKCGCDGVISSPLEIKDIKEKCGKEFSVITPGIRPSETKDDQKRVATPKAAVDAGADFIVVGRPIIEASDPKKVAEGIFEEIN